MLYITHTRVVIVLIISKDRARKINCQISRMLMTLIFL